MRTVKEIRQEIMDARQDIDLPRMAQLIEELAKIDDPSAEGFMHNAWGLYHRELGEFQKAIDSTSAALASFERVGDREGIAITQFNLGYNRKHLASYTEALSWFERALQTYRDINDQGGIGTVMNTIGSTYTFLGEYPKALEYYRRAQSIFEELGDSYWLATIDLNLGSLYMFTGELATALATYSRARSTFETVGNELDAAGALGNIAGIYFDMGEYKTALETMERAAKVYKEKNSYTSLGNAYANMVLAFIALGDIEGAAEKLELLQGMNIGDMSTMTSYYEGMAGVAEAREDLDMAQEFYEKAIETAKATGFRRQEADNHLKLRDLYQKKNDFQGYIEHNNEYMRIVEEIRGKDAMHRLGMMEAEQKIESELRERDKERALLYGALPESVATRMIRGESVSGDHYDSASVIFLDIANFTKMSDSIPPGHVVHLLEQIFSTLDVVVERHGVTKIKTIGDSYMAVAGLPEPLEDHAQRAASCALDMLATLNDLQISVPSEMGETSWVNSVGEIKVRIGVHCGPVTAGVLGTKRLQYDVWGDTVNIASRMESTGEPGMVQISEAFADIIAKGPWKVVPRGEISVKGKGTMITCWLEGA